jgi:arsenite methyltransferase
MVTESLAASTKPPGSPSSADSCCSAFYEQDWVRQLAADSFHPGGEELTQRAIAAMNLPYGAALADLGCGTGTTALMLARKGNLQISAVDLSASNIERASRRMKAAGATARFHQADAHDLPFSDQEMDGILAECSFSLFARQRTVLSEARRVLRPGGKLAVTDMAVNGQLPGDFSTVIAPWTCLVEARDRVSWTNLFEETGFRIQAFSDESEGLIRLAVQVKRKLLVLGTGILLAGGAAPAIELVTVKHWLNRFEELVQAGSIRYLRFNLQMV